MRRAWASIKSVERVVLAVAWVFCPGTRLTMVAVFLGAGGFFFGLTSTARMVFWFVTDEYAALSGVALVVVVGGRTKEAKMVGGRTRGCGRQRAPVVVGKSVTQGADVAAG